MTFMKKALLPMASAVFLMLHPIAPSSAESGTTLSLVKSQSYGYGKNYKYGALGRGGHNEYVTRRHRYYGGHKVYPAPRLTYETHHGYHYGKPGGYGNSPKIVCDPVNRVVYYNGKKALVGGKACRTAYGSYSVVPGSHYLIRYLGY